MDKGKTWHHRICQYICGISSNPNTAFCLHTVFLPALPPLFPFLPFTHFSPSCVHTDTVPPLFPSNCTLTCSKGVRREEKRGRIEVEKRRRRRKADGAQKEQRDFDKPAIVWQSDREQEEEFNSNYSSKILEGCFDFLSLCVPELYSVTWLLKVILM